MSISTKTGDDGTTGLLYNRRVSKTDIRIEANGGIDELSANLGLARAALKGTYGDPFITERIFAIQKELVSLMGEIAVLPQDRDRYRNSGQPLVTPAMVGALTELVYDLEKNHRILFAKWATPGETLGAAALDMARTVCRRAERGVIRLREIDPELNVEIPRYLNRLSDLCWLWARWVETRETETK